MSFLIIFFYFLYASGESINKTNKKKLNNEKVQIKKIEKNVKVELPKVGKDEYYYYQNNDNIVTFKTKTIDGLIVSDTCENKETKCLALQKVKENSMYNSHKGGRNPASLYCLQVGGNPIIVRNEFHNIYGFCEFADKSKIDEWSLYNKWSAK